MMTWLPACGACLLLLCPDTVVAQSAEWGSDVQVSNTGGASGGSVGRGLAIDSKGHLHTVWNESTSTQYDVYYARSTDGGETWSAGYDLSRSPLPATGANIAVGPDDTLHVAWTDRRDGGNARVYYSRSFNSGASWETPREVSGDLGSAATPSISVDLRNRVHIAWHTGDPDSDSAPAIVFYTHSLDAGASFTGVARLSADTGHHAAWPRFSVDGVSGDTLAIAWRDNRAGSDWDLYMAVSSDAGSSFVERPVQVEAHREWDPDVMVDPEGQIHVAYMHYVPGTIEIKVIRSRDYGETWTTPVVVSEAAGRFPFWAANWPRGLVALFWKDERDDTADIVVRYSFDAGLTWTDQEWVTDDPANEAKFPSPAVGPDGRPHVVWSDERLGASREALFVKNRASAPAPAWR